MVGRYYLLVLGALACGAPGPSRAPTTVAPWLKADPRRCLLRRDLREGMEMMAQRCAEEFVRVNGYTDAPAADDSTRQVLEWGEGGPWTQVLESRAGSLERSASSVQCSSRKCFILFRLRRPVMTCAFRLITMTQVFTRIQIEPGAIRDIHCGERRA
jgi:hypothetical protein